MQIGEASQKAKAKIKSYLDEIGISFDDHHRNKYPFNQLRIGQCFTVPFPEASEMSLRISAVRKSKATGKKFAVIKHHDFGVIEVARIA